MSRQILSVASELYPLVKTGGLADVTGALPGAVSPHGCRVRTLLPGYPAVKARIGRPKALHRWTDLLGVKAALLGAHVDGLDLLILDAPALFDRPGGPYADATGVDFADNWRRFAALSRAAADIAGGGLPGYRPDLVHAHDWQAGLTPLYLRYGGSSAPSVITIHNIAFQGRFDAGSFASLGLPPGAWSIDAIEYFGGVGFLKAGLAAASAVTTVSPTYAREIRTPEFGMGLEGLVRARGDAVSGIVNGIDPAVWNPATDVHLPATYTAATLGRRARNRTAIETAFGLDIGTGPLFTVVSRMTWQKGMDVLAVELDDLVAAGGRLALLGSGDAALEAAFVAAAERHRGRIGVRLGYDEALSHLLQGGADAILVPSRFEPCGLTQLYGLAYGCVPVVARTGGLADTVIDANVAALDAGVATGFVFDTVTPEGLAAAIARATALFADKPRWAAMQKQGMKADNSWRRSGRLYADLYRRLIEGSA